MKKHMVVLCGIYHPAPSPTGLCAKRYASLLRDEYDISIVYMKNGESSALADDDGNKLFPIENKLFSRIPRVISKVFSYIQMKILPLGNMSWYRKKALEKLIEIDKQRKIDAVFSICSPFCAHLAASDFVKINKDVTHLAYTVDMYSTKERIRPFWMSLNRLRKMEISALSAPHCLFLSEELYASRPDLKSANKNTRPLPYMLPDEVNVSAEKGYITENKINCVYAGRFYKDIRNPSYMLKVFSELGSLASLHLFSFGCEDEVAKYAEHPEIIRHTPVSHTEIQRVYQGADVLVGIGNTLSEFLPSKVYEYIMTLKPILFFNPDEKTNAILDRYPLCLQVSMKDDSEKNKNLICEFFSGLSDKSLSYEQIYRIYPENTPSEVKKVLKSFQD